VDHFGPWDCFDEASQNNVCGGRAVMFLTHGNFFKLKMGLGYGTNNYVELMTLKILLLFTGEKGIKYIHIFGDSLLVINWIWKIQKCHNITLLPLFL